MGNFSPGSGAIKKFVYWCLDWMEPVKPPYCIACRFFYSQSFTTHLIEDWTTHYHDTHDWIQHGNHHIQKYKISSLGSWRADEYTVCSHPSTPLNTFHASPHHLLDPTGDATMPTPTPSFTLSTAQIVKGSAHRKKNLYPCFQYGFDY